jgi:putative RNA 2'-phosphotransferase
MPLAPSVHESVVRLLSHALRHDPSSHLLEVDCEGWAPVDEVLLAIRCERANLRRFGPKELEDLVNTNWPRRFEIIGERIRALYGHSLPNVETGIERIPPAILFHGTSEEAWRQISQLGLLPMAWKMVHLTDDRNYAENVARAKSSEDALLLEVQATELNRPLKVRPPTSRRCRRKVIASLSRCPGFSHRLGSIVAPARLLKWLPGRSAKIEKLTTRKQGRSRPDEVRRHQLCLNSSPLSVLLPVLNLSTSIPSRWSMLT